MQVVVEKDRIVGTFAQQLHRFRHVVGDVDEISLKARREPAMPSLVVIKQKNAYRMTFSMQRLHSKFSK
jgi:hypothetical protein